jgi:hypothetical protein
MLTDNLKWKMAERAIELGYDGLDLGIIIEAMQENGFSDPIMLDNDNTNPEVLSVENIADRMLQS